MTSSLMLLLISLAFENCMLSVSMHTIYLLQCLHEIQYNIAIFWLWRYHWYSFAAISLASFPGSSQLFNIANCTRKMREPDETYHASDIAGWTDLTWFHIKQVGSTCFITHVISFTRLPRFSRSMLRSLVTRCHITTYTSFKLSKIGSIKTLIAHQSLKGLLSLDC